MSRLPGATVLRALRADRVLAAGFALLALGAWAPLFATPVLPFPDLHTNVAGAAMLVRTILRDPHALRFYRIDWLPFPYWTTYLLMGTLTLLFGPFVGPKLVVALLVVALPLAVLRLLLALGRDPRLSLWAFLVSWDHNVFAGWHSFGLGMALGLVVLAKMIEAGDDARAAARLAPWSVVLALTHAMAVLFVWTAAGVLALVPPATLRRARAYGLALSGSAISLVPWLVRRIGSVGTPGSLPFGADYPTAAEKVSGFFGFSLDNLRARSGELTAALAFTLLLLGPLAVASARSTEGMDRDDPRRPSGAALPLAALLLYATLPMALYGPITHWYTYPRYATYALLTLVLVPAVRKVGTRWLVPVVALALAGNVATASALRGFGARVRPFTELVDAVPPGARLLPLEYVADDEVVKFAPLAHVHSYITTKGLYDPHMFDDPNIPIRYREGLGIPRVPWLGPPRPFTFAAYAPHYDYVLVQGSARDPFPAQPAAAGYHVTLAREAGIWRLYRVEAD
jgi:hypothetical protein